MNNENLAKVAKLCGTDIDEPGRYAVSDGSPRLYCDGHIICVADDLEVKELNVNFLNGKVLDMSARATEMFSSFLEHDPGSVIVEGALVGDLVKFGYVRVLSDSFFIQERFRRCFDAGAEFRGVSPASAITIYEQGVLKAVMMPVKITDLGIWPAVPYLADDVLYHACNSGHEGC